MDYSAPQIAGRDEPFHSAIQEHLKGHTQGLEDLAIEMLARGLSVRDIEDAFNQGLCHSGASETGIRQGNYRFLAATEICLASTHISKR
jgi:hypothetical protein